MRDLLSSTFLNLIKLTDYPSQAQNSTLVFINLSDSAITFFPLFSRGVFHSELDLQQGALIPHLPIAPDQPYHLFFSFFLSVST